MRNDDIAVIGACTRQDITPWPQTKTLVVLPADHGMAPINAKPKTMLRDTHLTIHDVLYAAMDHQHHWQSKADHIDSKKPFHKRAAPRRAGDRRNWI